MSTATYGPAARNGGPSLRTVVLFSVLFHGIVLVGIPLLLKLTERSVSFERPPTFQLVTSPPSPEPAVAQAEPERKLSKPEPVREKSTRKTHGTKPVPKDKSKHESREDVEELASVLDELQRPASVASKGDFKFNWYNAAVQSKIERYWNPAKQTRTDSVVVSFYIYQNGAISEPEISSSSDHSLDNTALRAVKLAAPFPKLPPDFSENKVEFGVTLKPTTGN